MPEGHTIHRLARDQMKTIAHQRLRITSPQGRFADHATLISGKRLTRIEAAGKHLFYHFGRDLILHVHLGLFGKYRTHDNPPPSPRGAVRVRFQGVERTVESIAQNTNRSWPDLAPIHCVPTPIRVARGSASTPAAPRSACY